MSDAAPVQPAGSKRKVKIILLLLVAAALAVAGRMGWRSTFYEVTDNAYVHGHISAIAPRVKGVVTAVHFDDNQQVQAGDLLVELDPADYQVQVDEIQAELSEVDAGVARLAAETRVAEARVQAAKAESAGLAAELHRYSQDAERQRALRSREMRAVTASELDAAVAQRDQARAALAAHEQKIRAAQASVEASRAAQHALEAKKQVLAARLEEARLQLGYTRLYAPVDGLIGNKSVEVGDHVAAGQRLLALIQNGVWVTANFKETQLEGLTVGQQVDIRLDSFPGQHLRGRVDSFAPASGARFALLPPDNATGNFTKIVQRVPVKITFDTSTPASLMQRIVPGMSALIEIDLRQGAGL